MEAKGKAYANKKSIEKRPESDFYPTPKSLVWLLLDKTSEFDGSEEVWEPACGDYAISSVLEARGFKVKANDLKYGDDFLSSNEFHEIIITNPPFSMFDEFVKKAKTCCDKFAFIGKTNFFGAYQRHREGLWKNLKSVYIFSGQVDYRSPTREDGLFHVGNLVTGWFVFDKEWHQNYWNTKIIDVQDFAKLGQLKKIEETEED